MERWCDESTKDGGSVRRSREPRGELERCHASESKSGVDEWMSDRASR